MTPNRTKSSLALVLAGVLSACSASKEAARGVEVEGPTSVRGPSAQANAGPQISTRAKLLFEDGVRTMNTQRKNGKLDYAALERKFQAAVDEDANLAEAEFNLGWLAERQGKKDKAIAHYKTALSRKPTLRQAAENLAVIAQNNGDVEGASRIYQNILDNYPDDASSRARLAELYRRNGDHERAMQMAREALMREPKTLTAYKVMMNSYLDRKELSMAKLVALRAIKLDENDPELYQTMGQVHLAENDTAKARLQFKKAVEVRPDYLPAHATLAKLSLQGEDYAGAETHLRRLLQSGLNSAELHLDLGVAYKGLGQYDKALQEYDAAEKLNPQLAAIYLNRGIIFAKHKDAPEKGLEYYEKFMAMAPESDSNVGALVEDARQMIAAKEEAKRQEEIAKQQAAEEKRLAEEEKRQQEEMKKLEAQQKAQEKGAPQDGPMLKEDDLNEPKAPPAGIAKPKTPKTGKKAATVAPAKGAEPKADPPPPASKSDEPQDSF
jgi:tetratricopeptide (TPR) repeat protein